MPQLAHHPPQSPPPPVGRLAYLRIHAYGLFLGLLAAVSGALNLANPSRSEISAELGRVPASLIGWSSVLLVGGLLVLQGMIRRDMRAELLGLAFTTVAVTWSTVGTARVFGAASGDARSAYLLLGIVLLVAGLRASALLAPGTLYVVYPGRRRRVKGHRA